jgi:hypothetical protein
VILNTSIGVGICDILTKKKVGPAQPQLSAMADNYPADWPLF